MARPATARRSTPPPSSAPSMKPPQPVPAPGCSCRGGRSTSPAARTTGCHRFPPRRRRRAAGQRRPDALTPAGPLIAARDAHGLRISGTGRINGRAREFMRVYDERSGNGGMPRPSCPRLARADRLPGSQGPRHHLRRRALAWTLHLVGCAGVLVDDVKIRNLLDVPNCDGIDPDHCRDVEIRNCDIVCGDDAIVVKATRQGADYGGSPPTSRAGLCDRDAGLRPENRHRDAPDISTCASSVARSAPAAAACTIQLRDEGGRVRHRVPRHPVYLPLFFRPGGARRRSDLLHRHPEARTSSAGSSTCA